MIDGAAYPSDEELVEYLLVSGCMSAVTGQVCCRLILPQYSHNAAACPNAAGSGPTAAKTAESGDGPCKVPAVNTCSPACQLPAARRAALALMLQVRATRAKGDPAGDLALAELQLVCRSQAFRNSAVSYWHFSLLLPCPRECSRTS